MKSLKVVVGALVGLLVGTVFAFLAVVWEVRRMLPPSTPGESVGIDINVFWHEPIFWVVLLCNVIGFAYSFSRIGHDRQHSHL